jgi:hypothetical protein
MHRIHQHLMLCSLLIACLQLTGQAQDGLRPQHVGRVQDWSYHHVTVSGGLRTADFDQAKTEPRLLFRLAERNLKLSSRGARRFGPGGRGPGHPVRAKNNGLKIDWSVSLGTGIVAPNMFPAKYNFDINATPDCANDFVVYGLNVAGATAGQANLVGLNQLYRGTGGLCGTGSATVNWAYNGSTAGGSVLTSPVISLDGTKIAYVESAAASTVFHILTWQAGQGTSATSAVAPTLPSACAAATSCLKSLTLSASATDTLSSPWVDYKSDKAFVGTDDGKIYRISCVFSCALNAQPTIDWVYNLPVAGTGGATAILNGPVYDAQTGRLIVGDQLGELWTINAKAAAPTLFAGPVMIGGGGCTIAHPPGRTGTSPNCTGNGGSYGIADSVILDGTVGKIFAFTGNDGTNNASATVAQLNEDLTGLVRVHVGLGSVGATIANWNLHTGAFDDAYFGNTPATGHLFLCGTDTTTTQPFHYWIGFSAYPAMDSAPTASLFRVMVANVACSPYTELFNPNINLRGVAGHHDLLVSGLMGTGTNGLILANDISTGAIVNGQATSVNYPGGVSGIIVDNVSTAGQASSVYFSTQGVVNVGTCVNSRCAVKLTQLSLN